MLKRNIGISCGVIATLYVTQVIPNLNLNNNVVHVVSAEESCATTEECDDQIQAAQRRISDVSSGIDEAESILSEVKEDWSEVIARIETTQLEIEKLGAQIEETSESIQKHREDLDQLDEEIDDLQELIGYRMRIAQRMNNGNEILGFLTESETIVELIRRVRTINHLSKSDAELMEELNIVIDRQQTILIALQKEQTDLTAKNQQLDIEEATLAADQKNIEDRMSNLGQQIEANQNAIIDEEEALRIAEAQKEVLAQLEIPEVFTEDNSSEESTSDNDNEDTSDGEDSNSEAANSDENNDSGSTNDDKSNTENSNGDNAENNSGDNAENNSGNNVENNSGDNAGNNSGDNAGNSGGNNNTGGSNTASTPINSKFIRPMSSGVVTCEWMCYTNHRGIDISNSSAVPILAAASGLVTTSGWHDAYGNWVIIEHNINGERYGTLYAHMRDTPMVRVGDNVTQGQQLGNMGSTGNSTGPHLHFEIHPGGWGWNNAVNPRNYISFPSAWTWF